MLHVTTKEVVHSTAVKTLGLGHGTVFVRQKKSFEINNFFSQLCDSGRESIVLCAEQLDLSL